MGIGGNYIQRHILAMWASSCSWLCALQRRGTCVAADQSTDAYELETLRLITDQVLTCSALQHNDSAVHRHTAKIVTWGDSLSPLSPGSTNNSLRIGYSCTASPS